MKSKLVCALLIAFMLFGCVSPMASKQRQELEGFRDKGLEVEEVSTSTATALGLLPGVGSFYTRNYVPGVLNLLLWPVSMLWDPINGYEGALKINYVATKIKVDSLRSKEMVLLKRDLDDEKISKYEYEVKKREINDKFSPIM